MAQRLVEWMKTCQAGTCTYVNDRPGSGHPWLYHPYDMVVFVLSGELTVEFEQTAKHLFAGDSCDVPLGLYHRLVSGPTGCSYLTARPREDTVLAPILHSYAAAHR